MTKRKSSAEFDDNVVEEQKTKKKSKKEKRKNNDNGEEVTEEIESRSEDEVTPSTEGAQHGHEQQDRFPVSIPVKKTKKNRNRKKDNGTVKKVIINQEEPNPDPRIKVALKYLKTWYKHRDQWKFQKVRQLCLLQHMYDHTKISDRKFKRLLEYLGGLVGGARELTIKEAGQILVDNDIGGSDNEGDGENSEENEKLKTVKIKIERATQILQQLS